MATPEKILEENSFFERLGTKNEDAAAEIKRKWKIFEEIGWCNGEGNYGTIVAMHAERASRKHGIPYLEALDTFGALNLDAEQEELLSKLTPEDYIRLSREFESKDPDRINQASDDWKDILNR